MLSNFSSELSFLYLVDENLNSKFLICYFLNNHPRLSSRGTGCLFWVQVFPLKIIVLASTIIFLRFSSTHWGYIAITLDALFVADVRPSLFFVFVLELNVFGLTFLPYYPRCLVSSLLFPLLLSFFCWPVISAKRSAIARCIIKTMIYRVWLFRNKSTFRNGKVNNYYRAIIRLVSFDISSSGPRPVYTTWPYVPPDDSGGTSQRVGRTGPYDQNRDTRNTGKVVLYTRHDTQTRKWS